MKEELTHNLTFHFVRVFEMSPWNCIRLFYKYFEYVSVCGELCAVDGTKIKFTIIP